jgi:chromosome segregation ATPase
MTDEDFKNLEHSIGRHEGDLDQLWKTIESLEKQLSEIARENVELRESLVKTVILTQRIFVSIRTDPFSKEAEVQELRTRLNIPESL